MADDNNNLLFSDDVLSEVEASSLGGKVKTGPVTVLGHTFADDEERRAFFREELRKKLPELKKIEGFPDGEDDDIITLSDPPYYTACPNPWLNEFVAAWEEEKKQMIADGKRAEEKVVTEPYASDVSEGKNNPIYMAHAYHTKVPHPAIMRYILHYTEPGDIVFDGFCGTGMTGVAAGLCGNKNEVYAIGGKNSDLGSRKCLCSDLSPIASLISASYNLDFNPIEFEKRANEILELAEKEVGWLYKTKVGGIEAQVNYTIWSDLFTCPSCGQSINFWNEAVDLANEVMHDELVCPHCGTHHTKKSLGKAWQTSYDSLLNDNVKTIAKVPVRVNYTLPNGRRGEKDIDSGDLEIIKKAEDISSCRYLGIIPDGDESNRNYARGLYHLHQLFTNRNLIYLDFVQKQVRENPILFAWFTSVIQNASVMYKFRLDRKGGLVSGTLFVPSLNIEQNPAKLLKGKIKDFKASWYGQRGNSVVSIASATALETIADNSIDYMFIDPPFGANLMYSELNSIWEGWLHVLTNTEEEAIVNDSQHKTIFEYQNLMNRSLKEFYRILKPGRWITIEFSNTSASVWNSIQNALQGVGFVVANVAALDKKQGSFKAVTTTTAVKQDLVITCFKPGESFTEKFEANAFTAASVWDFIDEFLQHLPVHLQRENATTAIVERSPKILYDRVVTYYVQKGLPVPVDASEFQVGLRERYSEEDGMFFTPGQLVEYREKKKAAPEFLSLGLIVSNESDGIEWLRNQLRDGPLTYQQLSPEWMQAINGVRKGDILPELSVILEENFIQEANGSWRLPNIQDDVDKDKLREKALLKEFKIYVEAASKPHARIKEVRVEAIRAGFKKCYMEKDFATIVMVGDKIPQNLLTEDDILLQFYDIARTRV